jgi:hypothetical protein
MAGPPPRPWAWPLALFGAAFAIRIFFWRATADAGRPDSAYFKGDALLWMDSMSLLLDRKEAIAARTT